MNLVRWTALSIAAVGLAAVAIGWPRSPNVEPQEGWRRALADGDVIRLQDKGPLPLSPPPFGRPQQLASEEFQVPPRPTNLPAPEFMPASQSE